MKCTAPKIALRSGTILLHGGTGHRLVQVHGGIVQHGVSDACLVGPADGRVPFGLVIVLPHMVIQRLSAGADAFADDIAELEVLLVHHTLGPVDDGHLYGVVLTADMACNELELDPQIFIQFRQHGFADELGIVEDVVVIKHLAHFFFKEVHYFLLWYKSKVICSYSMWGRNELFAAAAGVFVSRNI